MMIRLLTVGLSTVFVAASLPPLSQARQAPQDAPHEAAPAPTDWTSPPTTSLPVFREPPPQPQADANPGERNDSQLKPLMEGPLHEAFLSPAKDRLAPRVEKPPPPPVLERPGVDPPGRYAKWIEGYWEWDPGQRDFVWVTGTWRVPPPGRFWVNGYWKRDGEGWTRVSGFWSDRQTDRLDYRKNGPPRDRPDDDSSDPPDDGCFFIPGQYYPDGDGVVWKPGFWARAQPGWAWVPAQWIRQPEGWVFQDGFWDRTLEDRGTLFTPAAIEDTDKPTQAGEGFVYQPYSRVTPELYGQLNGAFGRPNAYYDGYPGVAYDETGRYYGYAGYGSLGSYYGYLDYPFYGGYGYPYYASPVVWGSGGGFGYPYAGYGYGFFGGMLGGMFGFGYGAYPVAFGLGLGYPWYGYGGFGYPNNGYGYGGFGNAAFSYGGGYPWGGYGGFGLGGFGFGGLGLGLGLGYGYPWWGGFPWWAGGRGWRCHYPFHPGRHGGGRRQHPGMNGGRGGMSGDSGHHNPNSGHLVGVGQHPAGSGDAAGRGHHGIQAPPASRAFGNPFRQHDAAALHVANSRPGARPHLNGSRASSVSHSGNGWHSAYNGVHPASARTRHSAARPAFSHTTAGTTLQNPQGLDANHAARSGGIHHPGQAGFGNHPGHNVGQPHQGIQSSQHAGIGIQPGHSGSARPGASAMGNFAHPMHQMGTVGGARGGFSGVHHGGAALGSGFTGGGHMGGGFGGGHMGGGFGGGHMGGGFGGGHMGGGGHGGGGHR